MTDTSLIFLLAAAAGVGVAAWAWMKASAAEAALAAAKARLESAAAIQAERDAAVAERDAARAEAARLQGDLRAAESAAAVRAQAAAEREKAMAEMRAEFERNFALLATQALERNEQRFLTLANETFEKHKEAASGGVKEVLAPVQEAFGRLAETVGALDKARTEDKAALTEQMRQIGDALKETQGVAGKLVTALRAEPQKRGAWGEQTLRNVLEMAGLAPHIDYVEQSTHAGEAGNALRPDVIVRLPGERCIVIDAKVALTAYLDAEEASDPQVREAQLVRHAQQLREHVKKLGAKDYWKHVPNSADFVVLFVPGEHFAAEAAQRDPSLYDFAIQNNVIITTPTTLIALAKAVAYGWRQEEAARNAQEIAELGRTLYTRVATMTDKISALGGALETGMKRYNEVVASMESRVLPAARKFRELGAGEAADIVALEPTDVAPRLPAPQPEFDLTSPPQGAKAGKKR
ncbi:MAG: DNA recombination protein RmuC [Alphaproteobacteria bacterium]|nr:DNA recombination protein RmuC [Alphaproteobacteria bacterium]